MPLYEFRCRSCDDVFEVRRPMSDVHRPTPCPAGHDDTVRMLSMFASAGRARVTTSAAPAGGCCGGGCGCG